MKINEIIQEKRKSKKMTQRDLAEKLNVSDKTISRWENGNSLPDIDLIPNLANALDCTIEELFEQFNTNNKEAGSYNYQKILFYKIAMIIATTLAFLFGIFLFLSRYYLNYKVQFTITALILLIISIITVVISELAYRTHYLGKFTNIFHKQVERNYLLIFLSSFLVIKIFMEFAIIHSKNAFTIFIIFFIIWLIAFLLITKYCNYKIKFDSINIVIWIISSLFFLFSGYLIILNDVSMFKYFVNQIGQYLLIITIYRQQRKIK